MDHSLSRIDLKIDTTQEHLKHFVDTILPLMSTQALIPKGGREGALIQGGGRSFKGALILTTHISNRKQKYFKVSFFF